MRAAHIHSSTWFRSKDLGVMSPARYTSCAMLLTLSFTIYCTTDSGRQYPVNALTHTARLGAPRRVQAAL